MATIERFEDLEVWQKAMALCLDVYKLTEQSEFAKDFALKDQIRKSAISIPSNISEGFERNGMNQFRYFLQIAKGSCGELRTQIMIAEKLTYITHKEYNELNENCLSTSRQISGFMKYLKEFNKKNNP